MRYWMKIAQARSRLLLQHSLPAPSGSPPSRSDIPLCLFSVKHVSRARGIRFELALPVIAQFLVAINGHVSMNE